MSTIHLNNQPLFLGRRREIEMIEDCLAEKPSKNISIVGYPGAGKTALVKELLRRWSDDPRFDTAAFAEVSMASKQNERDLMIEIVAKCYEALEEKFKLPEEVAKSYNDVNAMSSSTDWIDLRTGVQKFFKDVRKCKRNPIVVLKEFDTARSTFTSAIYYNTLADLNNDSLVKFITISKRTIEEIEKPFIKKGNTVTFHRTFAEFTYSDPYMTVGFFADDEMTDFFDLFENNDYPFDETVKNTLLHFAGRCPKLLFECAPLLLKNTMDSFNFKDIFENLADRYNKTLLSELKKQEEITLFFDLCRGNTIRNQTNKDKIKKFLKYGILREATGRVHKAYSDYLQSQIELGSEGAYAEFFPNDTVTLDPRRLKFYISFSENDADYFNEIIRQLGAYQQRNLIEIRSQRDIEPGHLKENTSSFIHWADIVLILHSTDYNNECGQEIAEISRSKKRAIPVLCRQASLAILQREIGNVVTLPRELTSTKLDAEQLTEVSQKLEKLIIGFIEQTGR